MLKDIIRKIIRNNPLLSLKLKKSYSKLSPFAYVYQIIVLSFFASFGIGFVLFVVLLKQFTNLLIFGIIAFPLIFLIFYFFFFNLVDVKVKQIGREQDSDLLFILEFLLINFKSGVPIGIAIESLSKIDRPTAKFFKEIHFDIKTGLDIETAIKNSIEYSASYDLKTIMKRIYDSLEIGGNLELTLENQIKEVSQKKIVKIKEYSKKINPIITMYLLLGIVLPSLGITFFIIGATILEITPDFLRIILGVVFAIMFFMQYLFYSFFKFQKETI